MAFSRLFSPRFAPWFDLSGDPVYRWEVRRFWTRRWWIIATLVVLGGAGLLASLSVFQRVMMLAAVGGTVSADSGPPWWGILLSAVATLPGSSRLPLTLLAVIAGALAIAPERESGQLEQFVLTPIDPWRLGRARYAARMRGLVLLFLVLGCIGLAAVFLAAVTGDIAWFPVPGQMPGTVRGTWSNVSASSYWGGMVSLHCADLLVTLLLDGAIGLAFSSRMRSTGAAVGLALLFSFVVVPFIVWLPVSVLGAVVTFVFVVFKSTANPNSMIRTMALMQLGGTVLHMVLCLVGVRVFLRIARKGLARLFGRPEAV